MNDSFTPLRSRLTQDHLDSLMRISKEGNDLTDYNLEELVNLFIAMAIVNGMHVTSKLSSCLKKYYRSMSVACSSAGVMITVKITRRSESLVSCVNGRLVTRHCAGDCTHCRDLCCILENGDLQSKILKAIYKIFDIDWLSILLLQNKIIAAKPFLKFWFMLLN